MHEVIKLKDEYDLVFEELEAMRILNGFLQKENRDLHAKLEVYVTKATLELADKLSEHVPLCLSCGMDEAYHKRLRLRHLFKAQENK